MTEELDRRLLADTHRARWWGVAFMALILAAVIGIGAWINLRQQEQLRQSCDFFAELGTISITPPPGQPPPSKLAVLLQAHSRQAYLGEGCGTLPPPAFTLRKYAAIYHVRLPG